MSQLRNLVLRWGVASLSLSAQAQVPPPSPRLASGDGLVATYYASPEFDRPLVRRRESAINSQPWGNGSPTVGVPGEYFAVRWTGWLVPPASGRYVLHATMDDGMRVWLNDRLVLASWGPGPARQRTATVQLQAGQPYKLRVDYFQNVLDKVARLTWERPDQARPSPSWQNAWGLRQEPLRPELITSRYLFTQRPGPVAAARPVLITPKLPPTLPLVAALAPASKLSSPQRLPRRPMGPPRRPSPPQAAVATGRAGAPDSVSRQRLAQLTAGQDVLLPKLLFEQGQATLQPAARTALDHLAQALHAQPALRLEVQGHTDNQGVAELNRQLSQQRAERVCRYLETHGVAAARLRPVGYGGTRPVADNQDPLQRPRNRRVVLARW